MYARSLHFQSGVQGLGQPHAGLLQLKLVHGVHLPFVYGAVEPKEGGTSPAVQDAGNAFLVQRKQADA
jgi:hypothetical protein